MNIQTRKPVSRRYVLRGLGATVALPWLNAMAPLRATAATKAAASPLRMAFIYVPNGMHMELWTPKERGSQYETTPLLKPLERFRDDYLLLSGLASLEGRGYDDGGNHAPAMGSFLTGVHPRKSVTCGISVDQVAARLLGHHTRLPSLEMGMPRDGKEAWDKYPCVVTNTISWRTPTQPLPIVTSPRTVFDRLFGANDKDKDRVADRRSILDTVTADARRLTSDLGAEDRHKIEEYLTSVRDIELRLERAESMPAPKVPGGIRRPADEPPKTFADHLQLLGDMMVLAFQTDSTRICSLIFESEGSNRSYPEIGVDAEHHWLSHHNNQKMIDQLVQIQLHHMAQFAYLLGRLKETREGEGNLLDHSMIAFGCALGDGARHDHRDLPIILAGGGNGTIKPGRHVVYPTDTPLANLWLAMLERMGVSSRRLGDSTGVLNNLG